jgi:hypothetical protein
VVGGEDEVGFDDEFVNCWWGGGWPLRFVESDRYFLRLADVDEALARHPPPSSTREPACSDQALGPLRDSAPLPQAVDAVLEQDVPYCGEGPVGELGQVAQRAAGRVLLHDEGLDPCPQCWVRPRVWPFRRGRGGSCGRGR